MSGCTAPYQGHRTSSGAAACPVHGGRRWGHSSYSRPVYTPRPSYEGQRGVESSPSGVGASARPRWSPAGSSVSYTIEQVRALNPVRRTVELRAQQDPDLRDVFLCHAWDDRRNIATKLHELLVAEGVSVWFSEKDIVLGQPFLREIDRGLARSRTGLVLVTPALLNRVSERGVSDKELSELLARDLLIPVVHDTTYDALRAVSPLLGSRHGLSTSEDSLQVVAKKIAELVTVEETVSAAG